jgi:ribosome-binding factor A
MIASEVRRIVAPALRACPPECGVVTITEVEVSEDCSSVTVFLSALQRPDLALGSMEERRAELRHALRALELHRIPELRFSFDPRSAQGQRIEELLGE